MKNLVIGITTVIFSTVASAQSLPSSIGDGSRLSEPHFGGLYLPGGGPQDLSLGQTGDRTGNVIAAGPGNTLGYCPILGCIPGTGWDDVYASFLISSETRLYEAGKEHYKFGAKEWQASTAYTAGDLVVTPSQARVYTVVSGGTSGARVPTDTSGANFADGTATLRWINWGIRGAMAQQTSLAIDTKNVTGGATPWAASTAYETGEVLRTSIGAGNRIYFVENGGTSGTVAPTNDDPSKTFTDGTLRLRFMSVGSINSAVGLYNAIRGYKGGGPMWAMASNVQIEDGFVPQMVIGHEIDLTNNSGTDCNEIANGCIALFITPKGSNTSSAAIQIQTKFQPRWRDAPTNTVAGKPAVRWGLRFGGSSANWLAKDAVIAIDTPHARRGLDIGSTYGNVTFVEAGIRNSSMSTYGVWNSGLQSGAAFRDNSATPVAFLANGANTVAAFRGTATTPVGLSLAGTYATAGIDLSPGNYSGGQQIKGIGFSVGAAGGVSTGSVTVTSYMKLAATKVAGLPACDTASKGVIRLVDDVADPNIFRGIPTGGGSATSLVLCDGATWRISG